MEYSRRPSTGNDDENSASMTSKKRSPYYHIYLLTIWEELGQAEGTEAVLRFRLEDPSTGQKRGFASLEALADALNIELAKKLN